MKDIAIVYHSKHHGNTKKILDGLVKWYPIELIDVTSDVDIDISKYKILGFASGVYNGMSLHKSLFDVIKTYQSRGQKAFIIQTSGLDNQRYSHSFSRKLVEKGFRFVGCFTCKGFSDARLFKLRGCVSIGHPNDNDIENAVAFLEGVLEIN